MAKFLGKSLFEKLTNASMGAGAGLEAGHSLGAHMAGVKKDKDKRYDAKNLSPAQRRKIKIMMGVGAGVGALGGAFALPHLQEAVLKAKMPDEYARMKSMYEAAQRNKQYAAEEKKVLDPWIEKLKQSKSKKHAKSTYKLWAIKHHPDKAGGSADKMRDINKAWDKFKPEFEKLPETHTEDVKRPFRMPKAITRSAIGAGIGATGGAASDKNHRKRNAAIGAGIGAAGGYGIHRFMGRKQVLKRPLTFLPKMEKTGEMLYEKKKHLWGQFPEVQAPLAAAITGVGAHGMYKTLKELEASREFKQIKELKGVTTAAKHLRWAAPVASLGLGAYYARKKYMKKTASPGIQKFFLKSTAAKGALIGAGLGAGIGAIGDFQQNHEFKKDKKTHLRTLIGGVTGATLGGMVGHGAGGLARFMHKREAEEELEREMRRRQHYAP